MPYSYGCLALKYWCAESENKGQRKRLLHILQRPSEDYREGMAEQAYAGISKIPASQRVGSNPTALTSLRAQKGELFYEPYPLEIHPRRVRERCLRQPRRRPAEPRDGQRAPSGKGG